MEKEYKIIEANNGFIIFVNCSSGHLVKDKTNTYIFTTEKQVGEFIIKELKNVTSDN